MDKNIRFIKVFVPYNQYNHSAIYAYDVDEYGQLSIGTIVITSLGVGAIMEEEIPENKLPNIDIYTIDCLADEKTIKEFNKKWWSIILNIHQELNKKEKV